MTRWTGADFNALVARRSAKAGGTMFGSQIGDMERQERRQGAKTGMPKSATKTSVRMSEHAEQASLIRMCELHEAKYPGLELIHAIPNGGKRHVAVAKKLKAEGVKAGVPDVFLPVPRGDAHGLYIELKAKGGNVSDAQRNMLTALEKQGYACIVAYGWENAWAEIKAYLESTTILLGARA